MKYYSMPPQRIQCWLMLSLLKMLRNIASIMTIDENPPNPTPLPAMAPKILLLEGSTVNDNDAIAKTAFL